MLLIALSWIYIALTCLNLGFVFKRFFKIKTCHLAIHLILGLFLYTLITSIAAFFIRIHIEFYSTILILNCILAVIYKKEIVQYLNALLHAFKAFKIHYKLLYALLFLVVLAQSTTKPYLIDNESYYIQTIKWINTFGYVKGLANLHLFLGQNSSWHALQAGFNFPFISNILNDINGFVFVVMGFLFVEKISKVTNSQDYFLGLVLGFSLFFMQFVNAPSPDLIIFLLAPYVIYKYLLHHAHLSASTFNILFSIVLFLCLVKVTMVVFAFLIFLLFIKNFKTLKVHFGQYTFLSVLVLGLFLLKNAVISGYLLYPTSSFDILSVDWKLPPELIKLYQTGTYQSGMNNSDVSHFSFIETFKYWLQIPKLHGLFNKLFLLLLIVFPLLIFKSKNKQPLLIIYLLAILQFVIVWLNSPQYRFFFIFIVILSLLLFVSVFKSRKFGVILIYVSLVLSAIPVFIPINLNTFTSNNFAMSLSNFKIKNSVIPEGNTKTSTSFSKETTHGFSYNSPGANVFFWGTGNGNLPCVNKQQVAYIKTYYHYVPQLRTNEIKDGFKSLKVKE
jgi:hypothetical protein